MKGTCSFILFLSQVKADVKESAKRIWKDLQQQKTKQARNEGDIKSFRQMKQRLLARLKEDSARYKKYYQIDHRNESHYDLVLDSTHLSAEQVAEKIILFIKQNNKTYKATVKKGFHGRNRTRA